MALKIQKNKCEIYAFSRHECCCPDCVLWRREQGLDMRECPFCKKTESLYVGMTDRNHNYNFCCQVVCDYCGATGPSAGNKEDAKDYWNQRGD